MGELHIGACKFNCAEPLFLTDRKDAQFPVVGDQFCKMHVLNAHELSMLTNIKHMESIGVRSLRIDGRNYDVQQVAELVRMYKQVLRGEIVVEDNLPNTTRGHYFRGVL